MGKFAIECPKCGSINTASTGLFAKRKINCGTCGGEIDTKVGRITSKICPNCEKVFVYDQANTKNRRCPSCGEPIDAARTATTSYKFATINCPQCACAIEVDKTKEIGECPICGMEINIESELNKQRLVKDSGVSVIQYEGDNQTFIWKHPIEDFNYGSLLIVHESQEAIFFMNGQALDLFGPGRHELTTENIPLLKKQYAGNFGSQTPFHVEVYFINKTVQALKWGTRQRIQYDDPELEASVTLGASGEFKLYVDNARKLLLKILGTGSELGMNAWEEEGDSKGLRYESIEEFFDLDIQNCIRTYLPKTLIEQQISIFALNANLDKIGAVLCEQLNAVFSEYGLTVPRCNIAAISVPEDDPNYQKWKSIRGSGKFTARMKSEEAKGIMGDVELEMARAEAEKARTARYQAELQNADIIAARDAAAERERIRLENMRGMSEASVMQAKGYSQKDVLEADVQKAYAAGMGQMGSGGGNGGGGGGMASEMVGMMMGAKMANMMMDRFEGVQNGTVFSGAAATDAAGWDCACGQKGNTGKFCSNCGGPKPEPQADAGWDCVCGKKGNTGKFCSECGKPKPEAWDCACGKKGNTGKFCSECGQPKPETWDCACGQKNNSGKCCPECGKQRPE